MFEKEPYYNERIEAYLRDQLSAEDKVDFEQSLQQDPLLQNEFLLQKDIMGSIQSYRKAELKQRLQQIDVSNLTNSGAGLAGSAGWWIAGALIVSIAGWLTFGDQDIENQDSSVVADQSVPGNSSSTTLVETPKSASPAPFSSSNESANTTIASAEKKESLASATGDNDNTTVKSKSARGNLAGRRATTVSRMEQPTAKPTDNEPLSKEESFAGNKLPAASSNTSQRLNVTDNTNSHLKQHYFYQNGQITLLGFDQPYTLLEIQSENVTYLYYEGNFYRLDSAHHNPTPIRSFKVTDQNLIESLKQSLTSRE